MLVKLNQITGADNSRQNADGSYEVFFGNTSRQATAQEVIDAKTLLLREEVNAERDRRETLGLTYQFPDGQGTIQTRDLTDFRNIAGQVSAATILMMQGVTDPVLWFIDADNVKHPLTPEQMLSLGIAVQLHISRIYDAAATIKNNIDPDNFDLSLGWP